MKPLLSIIFATIFLALCVCEEEDQYTSKYDNVDLDEILASERLLQGYVNCLLDKGPCTADAKELKKNLPDAIGNNCSKCTAKQKEGSDRVMHHLIDNKPDDWKQLEQKYQSDGSYLNNYLESKLNDTSGERDAAKSSENNDQDD